VFDNILRGRNSVFKKKGHRITSTGIGATIGALCASGLSRKEIRALAHHWQSPHSKKS